MAEILAEHTFTNGQAIRVGLISADEQHQADVDAPDVLALSFETPEKTTCLVLRPDEAVITIKVLAEALCKSVEGYTVTGR